ncbi:alpha/beta fold hydrolase [soil metagenome]
MTTFVFIPGAGGNAWLWHLVEAELKRRGFDALSVDLPADDDAAEFETYRDVVLEAMGDRTGIVLVAQSLGGYTAPLVVGHADVRLIVLFAAMIPLPGESAGEWWTSTGQGEAMQEMAAREGRVLTEEFDAVQIFLNGVPTDLAEEAGRRASDQSGTPFEKPFSLAAWPDIPTRFIAARNDRFFPLEFQRRQARERLGIDIDEIDGGHLANLSHPGQLVELLVAYATSDVAEA